MSVQLTQQDITDLKKEGYGDEEINKAIQELEQEELQDSYNSVQLQNRGDARQYSQQSAFSTARDDNLIKWQLELNDILERAEHILRGDVPKYKDGHMIWEKNPNSENNPLNAHGVELILKTLSLYINRNTILSDYEDEEIREKVFDFGRELNNLIFMKYDEIGMDTEKKRKEYGMIVLEMKDLVHSAYKRALNGGERRSLREMINVQQSSQSFGTMQGGQFPMGMPQSQTRSILNPMRYVKGKYV